MLRLLLFIWLFLGVQYVMAQDRLLVPFTGKITKEGLPIPETEVEVEFTTDLDSTWKETHLLETDENSIVRIELGSQKPLSTDLLLNFNKEYIEFTLKVDGKLLTPNVRMYRVGFASYARRVANGVIESQSIRDRSIDLLKFQTGTPNAFLATDIAGRPFWMPTANQTLYNQFGKDSTALTQIKGGLTLGSFTTASTANIPNGTLRFEAGQLQISNNNRWQNVGTSYTASEGLNINNNQIRLGGSIGTPINMILNSNLDWNGTGFFNVNTNANFGKGIILGQDAPAQTGALRFNNGIEFFSAGNWQNLNPTLSALPSFLNLNGLLVDGEAGFNEGIVLGESTLPTPTEGTLHYNPNGYLELYDSANWRKIAFEGTTTDSTSVTIGGNAVTSTLDIGTTTPQNMGFVIDSTRIMRLEYSPSAANFVMGRDNSISYSSYASSILGGGISGMPNVIMSGFANAIISGINNTVSGSGSIVGAGQDNEVSNQGSFIGAGEQNEVSGQASFIGTGELNTIEADESFVGAGNNNQILDTPHKSFIGAGANNTIMGADAYNSFIGAGTSNSISGNRSFIGAGSNNSIGVAAVESAIIAGNSNIIEDNRVSAFIGGGFSNTLDGNYSVILGGTSNSMNSTHSSILAGTENEVNGAYSLAAGSRAKINHEGVFLWADTQSTNFSSPRDNYVGMRAEGGYDFFTDLPTPALTINNNGNVGVGTSIANAKLDVNGDVSIMGRLEIFDTDENIFIGQDAGNMHSTGTTNICIGKESDLAVGSSNNAVAIGYTAIAGSSATAVGFGASAVYANSTAIGNNAIAGAINTIRLGNTAVTTIEGQVPFSNPSDKRLKENIKNITVGLDFIRALRPVEYNMIKGNGKIDYGFIAQELEQALPNPNTNLLNKSGQYYTLRYTDLIAPLVKALQELDQENKTLQEQVQSLKAQNQALQENLEKRLDALEKTLKNQ